MQIVKCEECPYKKTCLPFMIDQTITGCGMPLYWAKKIRISEVTVEHSVKEGRKE